MKKTENLRGLIVLALVAVGMFALVFAVQAFIAPGAGDNREGSATINVSITDSDGAVRHVEIETSAAILADALLEHNLIEGESTPFGLFVTVAGGVSADANNQEWWQFSKNGEPLAVGVDRTVISDGDHISIELMIGF